MRPGSWAEVIDTIKLARMAIGEPTLPVNLTTI